MVYRSLGWFIDHSQVCNCNMTFSVYLPSLAWTARVPAVCGLSGLTCADDNCRVKVGAQRCAVETGFGLDYPRHRPVRHRRARRVGTLRSRPEGTASTSTPLSGPGRKITGYYDCITRKLPALVEVELPLIPGRRAIHGHSMGGYGALAP